MHLAETLLLNCYRLIFATARLMNLSSLMLNGEMPDPGVPTPRMTIQPPCSETCPPSPDQPFLLGPPCPLSNAVIRYLFQRYLTTALVIAYSKAFTRLFSF